MDEVGRSRKRLCEYVSTHSCCTDILENEHLFLSDLFPKPVIVDSEGLHFGVKFRIFAETNGSLIVNI